MGQLARNSFYGTITFGLRFVSNAVLFVVIARFLGVEEFGRFAFAVSFTGIFLVVVDYGFCLQIVRDVALAPEQALQRARGMLNAKIVLSLAASILLWGVTGALEYQAQTREVIYILWCAFLFYSFGLFFNSIFKGLNRFDLETWPTVLLNLVQFSAVLLLLVCGAGAAAIALGYLLARLLYFGCSYHLVRSRLGRFGLRLDLGEAVATLKGSLSFGMHTILGTLYFQLDTVFLSHFGKDAEVGEYQAAMRLVLAALIVYDAVAGAYFPLVAGAAGGEKGAFRELGRSFHKHLLLLGGAAAAALFLYASHGVRILYGAQYSGAAPLLQILAAVVFLRFAGGAYAAMITVSDRQGLRAAGVLASVVCNVILSLLLIPRYGAAGAALVSVATHLLLVGLYALFSRGITGSLLFSGRCWGALVILGAGTAGCHFAAQASLAASLGGFAATLALVVFAGLDAAEKKSVGQLLQRRLHRRIPAAGEAPAANS